MLHWFAKRLNEAQKVKRDERGFTLIELLVVVIIIGILAAIAIPVFLSQRGNAQDAAAKANLQNFATAEASHAAALDKFTATAANLRPYGFQPDSEPKVTIAASTNDTTFCATAPGQDTSKFVVRHTQTAPKLVGSGTPAVADC